MQLYSTNNPSFKVELKEAVMQSLAPDKGLYMPEVIPVLDKDFIENIENYSFQEIAYTVSKKLIGDYIPDADLQNIVKSAIDFPAPVHMLSENIGALELWHGPSLAFKDFGARFMAALMSYFIKIENQNIERDTERATNALDNRVDQYLRKSQIGPLGMIHTIL